LSDTESGADSDAVRVNTPPAPLSAPLAAATLPLCRSAITTPCLNLGIESETNKTYFYAEKSRV